MIEEIESLRARCRDLEEALRVSREALVGLSNYADAVGSRTDEVHVVAMKTAQETLATIDAALAGKAGG